MTDMIEEESASSFFSEDDSVSVGFESEKQIKQTVNKQPLQKSQPIQRQENYDLDQLKQHEGDANPLAAFNKHEASAINGMITMCESVCHKMLQSMVKVNQAFQDEILNDLIVIQESNTKSLKQKMDDLWIPDSVKQL